ncbi:MAG: LysE family translocator [Bosea sp. (in: a-proteobacteria)]
MMLALAILPSFVLAATLVELTPGPNMAYLAHVALTQGRNSGLAAVAGVALGLSIIGILAALGVGALIDGSPLAYQALRWLGAAYLVWLAWDAWKQSGVDETIDEHSLSGLAALFRRGLITNLLNPKAAVFYVAMLPQFVRPELGEATAQLAMLTATYVFVATVIHLGIVLMADQVRAALARTGTMRLIRQGLALSLVAVAIWFLVSTAR